MGREERGGGDEGQETEINVREEGEGRRGEGMVHLITI